MIITGLLLGLVLGFVFQRGRFCVTGAFRDLFTIRSTRWLTAFMVIVAVQSVGVFALDALGVITLEAETFPWLGTIIGGLIFGFSIVLAGGCATGTYYRAGEGLVGSWFALIFYIVGATAFRKGPLAGTRAMPMTRQSNTAQGSRSKPMPRAVKRRASSMTKQARIRLSMISSGLPQSAMIEGEVCRPRMTALMMISRVTRRCMVAPSMIAPRR